MNKILVLLVACFLFSCQNETELSKMNWEQQIGGMISEYDINAQLDYDEMIIEDGDETKFSVYEANSKGVYKIVIESNLEGVFPLEMVYYIKNNKVITVIFKGLSPYIQ